MKKTVISRLALLAVGTLGVLMPSCVSHAAILDDKDVGVTYALDQYIYSIHVNEVKEEDVASDNTNTCKYPEFEGKCLAYVDEAVNVRVEPDEDAERAGSLPVHGIALVVEKGDNWTKIESGITVGYVRNDFLLFGDTAGSYAETTCPKIATVNTTTLYVRAEKDETSDCLTMIPEGESYEVLEDTYADESGWTHIQVDSDIDGYVSSDYVDISYGFSHALSVAEEEEIRRKEEEAERARIAEMTSTKRMNVVNYALQFLGNPYVYGGTSLTNGTDCSGFTMGVYAHFGYGLPRTAEQQCNALVHVDLSSIQPGDLLFYKDSGGGIGHVTMYIGGGQVVHASSSRTGIIISNVGYRTPCAAGRIIFD